MLPPTKFLGQVLNNRLLPCRLFRGTSPYGNSQIPKGIIMILQLKVEAKSSSLSLATPIPTNLLLKKLIFNLEASSKNIRMDFKEIKLLKVGLVKNKVSSANYNKFTSTWRLHTLTPFINRFSSASLISLASTSATQRNKRGARGPPFLNPLCMPNSSIGLPLTSTEIDADSTQPLIHFIHNSQNPSFSS